jgi:formylglycine-generating enzyme required for sulfatase activity
VAWLNQRSAKKHYSIPTQGEWMKVFRSGYFLDNGRALAASKGLCEIGNFYDISAAVVSPFPWAPNTCNDAFPSTAPVGAFLPSLDGVFDLVGNLWQLTRSCEEGGEISSQRQCKKVRLVGGSWATAPRWNWQTPPEITAEPDLVTDIFGLRVVATDRR